MCRPRTSMGARTHSNNPNIPNSLTRRSSLTDSNNPPRDRPQTAALKRERKDPTRPGTAILQPHKNANGGKMKNSIARRNSKKFNLNIFKSFSKHKNGGKHKPSYISVGSKSKKDKSRERDRERPSTGVVSLRQTHATSDTNSPIPHQTTGYNPCQPSDDLWMAKPNNPINYVTFEDFYLNNHDNPDNADDPSMHLFQQAVMSSDNPLNSLNNPSSSDSMSNLGVAISLPNITKISLSKVTQCMYFT